jgi:hypothetical protein
MPCTTTPTSSQKSKNLHHTYLMSEKDSKDALIHDSSTSNTFIPHLSWVDPNTFLLENGMEQRETSQTSVLKE